MGRSCLESFKEHGLSFQMTCDCQKENENDALELLGKFRMLHVV